MIFSKWGKWYHSGGIVSHIIDCMNFPDTIKKGNIEEHPEEVKELSVHGRLTISETCRKFIDLEKSDKSCKFRRRFDSFTNIGADVICKFLGWNETRVRFFQGCPPWE